MKQSSQGLDEGLIEKFKDWCVATGLSKRRVQKYNYLLHNLSNFLGKNFETATRADIEEVLRKIERSDYAEWTKIDHKTALKKFYKWLRNTEDVYPPEVRWIKTTMKRSSTKLPEEILNQEEVKKLIAVCTNLRDRAFVATLYESGCRIAELLDLKLRNIEFDEYGAVIRVHGKTGSRRIRLVDSVPYLTKWVADHPTKEADAPLLTRLNNEQGTPATQLSYRVAVKLLQKKAKRAGISKRVNPHSFRHARATHLASWMTDAEMCVYFGWEIGSDMPRTYCHLSGKDLDDTILRMHGKTKNEERKNPLAPRVCGRCQMQNSFDAPICSRCGLPFDEKMAIEVEKKREEFMNLVNSPGVIEKLIDQRVKEILKDKGITV